MPYSGMNEIPQEALDKMKKEGWATMEEQKAYWEKLCAHDERQGEQRSRKINEALDIGGNILLDRTEATAEFYDHKKGDSIQANEDEWKRNVEYQPAPDELKDFYYGDRDE